MRVGRTIETYGYPDIPARIIPIGLVKRVGPNLNALPVGQVHEPPPGQWEGSKMIQIVAAAWDLGG
jgi:hypothetical protein